MARITVLAGTNGAGKSSIAGAVLREAGGVYVNLDEATQAILAANPGIGEAMANGLAWQESVRRLRVAIAAGENYVFETTLGGRSVTALLLAAARAGTELAIWYCGLDSPQRHLTRVAARVARGGHNIPEDKIRARYDASRQNLITLMEYVMQLQVYDNSAEHDPLTGKIPVPTLVLEVCDRLLRSPSTGQELARTPPWAKALVAKAYQMFGC